MRRDRAGRGPGGADPSPALTIAARPAAAASRAAQDSKPTPSSNLAAAPRRRRRASPGFRPRSTRGGSAAPCAAAPGATAADPGARIPAPGTRKVRGRATTTPPDRGGAPEGPRSLGARHQVIPQEASRIGPGAQDRICISMAQKAPQGLQTDSGSEESGSARPSAGQVLGSSRY